MPRKSKQPEINIHELKKKILDYMNRRKLDIIPSYLELEHLGVTYKWIQAKYGSLKSFADTLDIAYTVPVRICQKCGRKYKGTRRANRKHCQKCLHGNGRIIPTDPRRPLTKTTILLIAGDMLRMRSVEDTAKDLNYDLEYLREQIKKHELEIRRTMVSIGLFHRRKMVVNEDHSMTHIRECRLSRGWRYE